MSATSSPAPPRRSTSSSASSHSLHRNLGTSALPDSQGVAHRAIAVTEQDTVIETADGHRLPGVPLEEARALNALHERSTSPSHHRSPMRARLGLPDSEHIPRPSSPATRAGGCATIEKAPAFTDPLFPPLPVYGPPTLLRRLQCAVFRCSSGVLSLAFLGVVVMGAFAESLPVLLGRGWTRLRGRDPDIGRPFIVEERARAAERRAEEKAWRKKKRRRRGGSSSSAGEGGGSSAAAGTRDAEKAEGEKREEEVGGKDQLVCDIGYYARRVGLAVETFRVETEDGFLLELQHVYDPADPPYYPVTAGDGGGEKLNGGRQGRPGRRRYPVLLMHGLLQSSGAFCVNDEDSLAFWLCKSGFDVFLGNNRCGFLPSHTVLKYSDPRMWAWNIRQMGVLDLPAFIDFILLHTSFPKLALIAHSQGTTQTFVALAKQQRPALGHKLSIFVALAPAVYAGPLINKFYFKFMKIIPPAAFRLTFGIHAFVPFMMVMHRLVPARLYGVMGYRVFWFLFGWSDTRWDRGLRDRFFRFAPVYVSAETMRWWLGRDGFARHRCILSTKDAEEAAELAKQNPRRRDRQRGERDQRARDHHHGDAAGQDGEGGGEGEEEGEAHTLEEDAWYDSSFPPLALWVAAADELVDGRRLLRRFEEGREPHVRLVRKVVCEDYEHLDVIWAIDAPQVVFEGVREAIWETLEQEVRDEVVMAW